MLRLGLILLLLFSFEAPAHAFWGALAKGLAKVAGTSGKTVAGKAVGKAGAVGAAKLAKPAAAGAAAGSLADDAARGAARGGGLGDDALRASDDLGPSGVIAAEGETGTKLGEHTLDVASNFVPAGEDEDEEDGDPLALADLALPVGAFLVVGWFVMRARRRRRAR